MYFELDGADAEDVESELSGIALRVDTQRGTVDVAFENIAAADNILTKMGCKVLTEKSELI